MTRKLLEFIEIESGETIEYSVIWLHGLGASGHDFEPIIPELNLLRRPGVRFLFPHAPIRPITINGGAAMRGWYDVTSLDFNSRQQDHDGIAESVELLTDLVDHEISRGTPAEHVILAGFSQGGAIALQAGYTMAHQVAGILALSTYLPMDEAAIATIDRARLSTPVFMGHGIQDDVIRIEVAERTRDHLLAVDASVDWHSYNMPHSVSNEEVDDMSQWFKRLFGM